MNASLPDFLRRAKIAPAGHAARGGHHAGRRRRLGADPHRPQWRERQRQRDRRRRALQHRRRPGRVDGWRRQHAEHRRGDRLEQQPDLRRHEHHHDAAEPAQRHHQRLPDDHEQRDPERHQRRGLAAGADHPARRPGPLQPADQRHPAGAPGLRPLEDDLPGHRQSDGGHGRRPGRLGPARRGDGAAGCGQQHRCRLRHRAGRVQQRATTACPGSAAATRAAPARVRSRWSAT
jgi:hypothetical protein